MQRNDNVFFTMLETVIKNRKIMLFVMLSGMALSWAVAFLTPVKFQSYVEFKIINAQASKTGGIGRALNIPGISLGQGEDVSENLSILKSRNLTSLFIEKYNLLPILYSEKWDKNSQAWSLKSGEPAPTLWKASTFFTNKVRTIDYDKSNQLVKMTMLWTDPNVATTWANEYLKFSDAFIADRARRETSDRIEFIQYQLNKNKNEYVRQSLSALLQEELKKEVLLVTSKAHVFKIIDPAVVPELKSEPLKGLIIAAGSFLSILIGIFAALLKESFSVYFKRRKIETVN